MAVRASTVNPLAGRTWARHVVGMADKDKDREERLAAALRENLRRRKTQARELKPADKSKRD